MDWSDKLIELRAAIALADRAINDADGSLPLATVGLVALRNALRDDEEGTDIPFRTSTDQTARLSHTGLTCLADPHYTEGQQSCMSIALLHKRSVVAAVVKIGEDVYTAYKGGPAELNGSEISPDDAGFAHCIVATQPLPGSDSQTFQKQYLLTPASKLLPVERILSVARGACHICIEGSVHEAHAAAALFIASRSGCAVRPRAKRGGITYLKKNATIKGGFIVTNTERIAVKTLHRLNLAQ